MNMTLEEIQEAQAAQESAAWFLAMAGDGSLSDLDEDEAVGLTSSASLAPGAFSEVLGIPPDQLLAEGPDGLQSRLMEEYLTPLAARDFEADEQERDETPQQMMDARSDSAVAYSGFSEDEVSRAFEDADLGDTSALTAIKEKFYLG